MYLLNDESSNSYHFVLLKHWANLAVDKKYNYFPTCNVSKVCAADIFDMSFKFPSSKTDDYFTANQYLFHFQINLINFVNGTFSTQLMNFTTTSKVQIILFQSLWNSSSWVKQPNNRKARHQICIFQMWITCE